MALFDKLAHPNNLTTRLGLALVSIFLLFISMPGSPLPLLTWIALVPAGLAISNTSARLSAGILYICAVGWYLLTTAMLIPALVKFTQLNSLFALFILFLFSLALASPYAIIGWLIGYKNWLEKPYGIFFISAVFTVIVILFPTVIPANHAHSLYQYPIFLQLLDLGGVSIILFIVVFVNWQFVKAIQQIKNAPKSSFAAIIKAFSTIIVISLYGLWKINSYDYAQTALKNPVKIGMVQPNLEREDKLNRLYYMSAKLVSENPSIDLLVWPEFPASFSYIENQNDKQNVDRLISIIGPLCQDSCRL